MKKKTRKINGEVKKIENTWKNWEMKKNIWAT